MKKKSLLIITGILLTGLYIMGDENSKDLFRFLRSGKWGLVSDRGTTIIEPIYDYVFPFRNGYSVVKGQVNEQSRRAYISSEGFQITGFEYDKARHFFGAFAAAQKDGKWGYINRTGEEVCPFVYDRVSDFDYGVGVAQIEDQYSLIRADGTIQELPDVTGLYFSPLGGRFRKNDLWGIMGFDGEVILEPAYERLSILSEDYLKFKEGDDYGLMDWQGNVVLPARYERLYITEAEGVFRVRENRQYRYITLDGSGFLEQIPYTLSRVWEKMVLVQKEGFYGLFNQESDEVLPVQYQGLDSFDMNGSPCYLARQDDKEGIVDEGGNWLVDPLYDRIYPFSEGLAVVVKHNKYGYINAEGEEQIPLQYDRAWDFSEGLAVVRQGTREKGKRGYIDKNGNLVIPLQYDWAYSFNKGMAHVAFGSFHEGTFGYIDRQGRYLVEPGR